MPRRTHEFLIIQGLSTNCDGSCCSLGLTDLVLISSHLRPSCFNLRGAIWLQGTSHGLRVAISSLPSAPLANPGLACHSSQGPFSRTRARYHTLGTASPLAYHDRRPWYGRDVMLASVAYGERASSSWRRECCSQRRRSRRFGSLFCGIRPFPRLKGCGNSPDHFPSAVPRVHQVECRSACSQNTFEVRGCTLTETGITGTQARQCLESKPPTMNGLTRPRSELHESLFVHHGG